MRVAVLLLGLLALVGCASPAPAGRTLVPVPVECREPVPDRQSCCCLGRTSRCCCARLWPR